MDQTFITRPATAAAAHRAIDAHLAAKARRDARPLKIRLSEAMREIAGGGGTCDRHALALRGFTSAELSDANILAARDHANQQAAGGL